MSPAPFRETFGLMPDGRSIERIWLHGEHPFRVAIITLGATVQALFAADRSGNVADVVLGHDALEPYLQERHFFGAAIGRCANRIAGGAFILDGRRYRLPTNDGPNTLHGGVQGFDRHVWDIESATADRLILTRLSPDGEEGFPGALAARITYSISGASALSILFEATTDAPTPVNLTHHGYFNLAGVEAGSDILDHHLTIGAESYLPVDESAIPLGAPAPVAGSPFDFRRPTVIGARIRLADEQLRRGRGYDHNYCLADMRTDLPRLVARAEHPASGRVLEVLTDQPGLQFYTGNSLTGGIRGKFGRLYRQSDALCLEPQAWPDAPNRPNYPGIRLDPGETYRHHMTLRFTADGQPR